MNKIHLSNPRYITIKKGNVYSYGGNQMWFPDKNHKHMDYLIHIYGCGTIATADLFLYLALCNINFQTKETKIAFLGSRTIEFSNYYPYVQRIHTEYTQTKRGIAVLGTKIASSINQYSKLYQLGLHASWAFQLTYSTMLDSMEQMLLQNIPVILSIGPNTPNLWGTKGIPMYNEISSQVPAVKNLQGHYVTVTAVIHTDNDILLQVSSWGKKYYINYDEYRTYIKTSGGKITSSLAIIEKI